VEYFLFEGKEYLVAGLDDGTIQVYDYSANKDKKSYERPIFKVTKEAPASGQNNLANTALSHPDEAFKESLYEHTDSVTGIERHFKNTSRFVTVGKDSSVCVWNFIQGKDIVVEFETSVEKH
jgi:WD40 repeat protein